MNCCYFFLLFVLIIYFYYKNKEHEIQKEIIFQQKHRKLQELKIEKEIKDLEVEKENENDEKKKKLLENEITFLKSKLNALKNKTI